MAIVVEESKCCHNEKDSLLVEIWVNPTKISFMLDYNRIFLSPRVDDCNIFKCSKLFMGK